MSFTITGLSPHPFQHLFGLPDAVLREQNIVRRTADTSPAFRAASRSRMPSPARPCCC